MKRKVISAVLAATMAVTMMMGCGSTGTSADGNGSTSKSEESGNDGGKVTLKVFSNLPDRKTGQGLVEQTIIDEYMKDANDAQLKVYFYLLRMLNAEQAISVSGIADKFNHTEKDVIRALKYWEKQQILDLDFDDNKTLVGIHLRDLSTQAAPAPQHNVLLTSGPSQMQNTPAGVSVIPAAAIPQVSAAVVPATPQETVNPYAKPAYSLDQLREFKEREETSQLLFIAEAYIGKPLTPSEIKTILFFTDVLHFSEDLIDYLLQYCVERGKKDFKYIEKVAVNWAEEGITTPKQAQKFSTRYDRSVYSIMNSLGRSTSPTAKELEFINRWTRDYGFSTDIILEACERSSLATDKHRFEYAEGILNSWRQANVRHKADIQQMDDSFQKKKTAKPASSGSSNRFTQFTQNSYDFAALEKEILSN